MSSDTSEAAAALARKRWQDVPEEERSEVARNLAAARWAGHVKKGTKPSHSRRRKPSKS